MGKDSCVSYRRLKLQLPPDVHSAHYIKATVRVHEYPDGTLAVFHGPRRLANYDGQGQIVTKEATQQVA